MYVRFPTTRNQGEWTGDDDPAPKHPQLLPGSPMTIVGLMTGVFKKGRARK